MVISLLRIIIQTLNSDFPYTADGEYALIYYSLLVILITIDSARTVYTNFKLIHFLRVT